MEAQLLIDSVKISYHIWNINSLSNYQVQISVDDYEFFIDL